MRAPVKGRAPSSPRAAAPALQKLAQEASRLSASVGSLPLTSVTAPLRCRTLTLTRSSPQST